MIHECDYAKVIGKEPWWLTADGQKPVCSFCHAPKVQDTVPAKTVRKA